MTIVTIDLQVGEPINENRLWVKTVIRKIF